MSTRKALVTGGGGAIAEALALRLDERGYDRVLTATQIGDACMKALDSGKLET